MDTRRTKTNIKKRRRDRPYRRWSDYETRLLIDFLAHNDFEVPNGKLYYEKFVRIINVGIDWTLVKNKVRNLRTLYAKADALKKTTVYEKMDIQSADAMIKRICPYYDELHDIFSNLPDKTVLRLSALTSNSKQDSPISVTSSEVIQIKTCESPELTPQHYEPEKDNTTCQSPYNFQSLNSDGNFSLTQGIHSKEDNNCDCNRFMEDIKQCLTEINKYHKARLELEEQRFAFEKEKSYRELELREKEMSKSERLQVLELESKERIAMKELEYKYKKI